LDLQLLQQGDNFELFGKVLTDSSEAKQKIKELNEKIEYQQKLHINFWLYHLILRLYPKLSEEYLEQAKEAYLNILKDFRVEENVYDE
jgi:dsRNA-specific ribonuclease